MDRGRLVDVGDPDALAAREPLYQALMRSYRQ